MKDTLRFSTLVLATCLAMPTHAATYDKSYIGTPITYTAQYEDTFVHLARDYELGYVELRAANPDIDPWIPGEGTKINLPLRHILPSDAPHEGIVINLPEMRLYAYVNGEEAPSSFPLGIGRAGLDTPKGSTTVIRKAVDPIWRPTKRMREEDPSLPEAVFPGAENPLGSHALYLGWPEYAIHGTNRPFGIGRRVSSGCIRLYPEAISTLFEKVPVGTKVTVIDQPAKLAWINDELYLEVHPTLAQTIKVEKEGSATPVEMSLENKEKIEKFAGEASLDWDIITKAFKKRTGNPVKIGKRNAPPPEEVAVKSAPQ